MSYDFPVSIERDILRYAQAEQISPTEAAVRLVQTGLKATRRKTAVTPLTDEELAQIGEMFPALDALADVSEEQWSRIDKSVRRMKRARLSTHA